MPQDSQSLFDQARNDALRLLVERAGLTPEQVSTLRLEQLHLATASLAVEPDEFSGAPSAMTPPSNVKLDAETQRALISWMVVRPDGPNNRLFPGAGMGGVDVATIAAAVAAGPAPPTAPPSAKAAPGRSEAEAMAAEPAVGGTPEPPVPADQVRAAPMDATSKPSAAAPTSSPDSVVPKPEVPDAAAKPADAAHPGPVSLEEIEDLRRQLAATEARPKSGGKPPSGVPTGPPEKVKPRPPAEPPSRPTEGQPSRTPVVPPPAKPRGAINIVRRPAPPRLVRQKQDGPGGGPAVVQRTEPRASAPITPPGAAEGVQRPVVIEEDEKVGLQLPYRAVVIAAAFIGVLCCGGLVLTGVVAWRSGGVESLIAGATATPEPDIPEAVPISGEPDTSPLPTTPAREPTTPPSPTPTVAPTQPPKPSSVPTDTPPVPSTSEALSSATPIVIVVTATPAPETPAATERPTRTPAPANTEAPIEAAAEAATEVLTTTFKYPAPVLLEPVDHAAVQGKLNILKWESVGPLADDEHYALRIIFLVQGKPVYEGDQLKVNDYRMPERFYYQADGPALEYKWFVFVERTNPDGSNTQLSPESETFVFRWD